MNTTNSTGATSPTPRTDAHNQATFFSNGLINGPEMLKFARTIERELTEMTAESQRNREAGQEWAAKYHAAQTQLTEAKEARDLMAETAKTAAATLFLAQDRAERAQAELTEARAEVERLAKPCGWPHCEPSKKDQAEITALRAQITALEGDVFYLPPCKENDYEGFKWCDYESFKWCDSHDELEKQLAALAAIGIHPQPKKTK
jgi:hypothetical protein